jgi:uncharacterized membrane protein
MADIFDELQEQPKKRTTFITVLCILTFIGSGWGLLSGPYGYFTAEKNAAKMQETSFKIKTKEKTPDKEGQAFVENLTNSMKEVFTVPNLRKMAISETAGAFLCLLGAFLMWRLNKKGYISYVAGVLLGIIVPIALFGNNIMGIFMSIVSGVVGLVFCILYAVNLKDMN